MAAERPLVYAAAFWAWDQHGFLQSPWPHYSPTIAGEPSANTSFIESIVHLRDHIDDKSKNRIHLNY